jgi:glyoxylase-like metal-dependent hydrolase (beta-lactamase superfamily II)
MRERPAILPKQAWNERRGGLLAIVGKREAAMSTFRLVVAMLVLVSAGTVSAEQFEAAAVLKRAEAVMGAGGLKTLRYSGSGSAWQFGQGYRAGAPWPKLNLASYTRLIDYDNAAWREDVVRSRAEPTGGGAVPLSGEQRLGMAVSGAHAWNQTGPAPAASLVQVPNRRHDLWVTPHGAIKAASKNNARLAFRDEKGRQLAAVSFTEPGQYSATLYINGDYLVERVESRMPNPVMGDVAVVTRYEDYRQHGDIRFPGRIRQSIEGQPVLELEVREVQPNAAVDAAVPEVVRGFQERVTSEKAADGVWYIAGASHHSVAIEMRDHVIVVESPLYDGRAAPMLAEVKKVIPGKPIRTVINSHFHFDHAGGLRTAVAEGAAIMVHEASREWFAKALANPNRISPDLMAKSGRKAKVIGARDRTVIKDASRTVEVYHIKDSVHAVPFLMVYLPKERLLIEADAYTPLAPNAAPPSPPNANNVNQVANIERLKLQVDRILPLHGRMVPLAELYRTVGR